MTELKQFILDFKGFVNENFDSENEPNIPGEGASETAELPKEVGNIATTIINGNFEGHKIVGIEGGTIKVKASKQDFKYAPEVLTLRDMGFEAWSGKPYDVKLELDDADPATGELSYFIEFTPKEARRAKTEAGEDEQEFQDEYEKPSEFEDLPETPEEDTAGVVGKSDSLFKNADELPSEEEEEEEDGLYEGRRKAQAGGFPKLKIKQAPKKDNPNLNVPKPKGKGFKPETAPDLMKKDAKKMVEVSKEKKEPPIKK